jgi:uroporphyrin-III C-methyltransferase/precorrin-2 dehydrogenase/sirohydrochlorin ferrochelatase
MTAPFPPPKGHISLVGAGPGAADLLTLRALRAIETADVVLYDRLVPEEILALIPAQTRRHAVGKEVGANAWPQARIEALMLAEAMAGAHVVRLKSGDPAIFGRALEEITAAESLGIAISLVPGITAASAAAASLGQALTTRGLAQRLVLATATDAQDGALSERLLPGTTLALYMATRKLAGIEAGLLAQGIDPETEIAAVIRASQPDEVILRGPQRGFAARAAADARFCPPAVLLLTHGQRTSAGCVIA